MHVQIAPFTVAIALFLLSASPLYAEVSPQKNWVSLRSANFHVIGDTGAGGVRQVARELEQFREAFGVLFPKAIAANTTPITVFVFRSNKSYRPFKPQFEGKPIDHIAGYFTPGETMHFITLTTEGGMDLGIVYHEYVHMLVNHALSGVPLWFNEGLAEYYRTFAVSQGRHAELGRIISPHVLLLREQFMPLATIAEVDHSSALYNESNRVSIFYAESWALVHYLLIADNQRFLQRVPSFLGALVNGVPFDRACIEALGISASELESGLRGYVRREAFMAQRVTFNERLGRIDELAVEPLPESQTHALLGELLLRLNRRDEAREQLEHALSLDPDSGDAHAALGLMYLYADDAAKALPHLKQATELPNATHQTYFNYAWCLELMSQENGAEPTDEERDAIERALAKTISLNPAFAEGYARLASYRGRRPDGIQEAVGLLTKAIDLAPGKDDYSLSLAYLFANQHDYARAAKIAKHLAARSSDQDVRQRASLFADQIVKYERDRAQWAAGRAGRDDAAAPGANRITGGGYRPVFRTLEPGETRVFGQLAALECVGSGIKVKLDMGGTTLEATAPSFEAVEFISHRADLAGQITCGPRDTRDPVMLVYRPQPGTTTAGTLVAIEFVPLDFKP